MFGLYLIVYQYRIVSKFKLWYWPGSSAPAFKFQS